MEPTSDSEWEPSVIPSSVSAPKIGRFLSTVPETATESSSGSDVSHHISSEPMVDISSPDEPCNMVSEPIVGISSENESVSHSESLVEMSSEVESHDSQQPGVNFTLDEPLVDITSQDESLGPNDASPDESFVDITSQDESLNPNDALHEESDESMSDEEQNDEVRLLDYLHY